jgi:DNA polymerase III epsilon subunit-like protein
VYLFFDTETTGIPDNHNAPASNLKNWPRLVQVAWLLSDEEGNEVSSAEYIVKPDGFVIPMDATKIHGITTELAQQNGVDLQSVLNAAAAVIVKAHVLVAHNIKFDEKILGAEFLRSGYPNPIESKERLCTMKVSTNYCCLPGNYGYKWPTLQELHMKLFEKSFEGAHRALVDVRACARCYYELKRRKIVD